MNCSLNRFYRAIDISKQSFHQRMDRKALERDYKHQLLPLIYQLREDHPTMSCRGMYHYLSPEFMGRDKFESFCVDHGFSSEVIRNHRRTTDSSGVKRFDNLTIALELNRINQLWVSDITYYSINNKFYYITFILDAFSRRIIGHHVSRRLFTEQTTLPALMLAVAVRAEMDIAGTIFHSDGGGQYYDSEFLKVTEQLGILNSMCIYPWENGKAERINGVIKNNYLIPWDIRNYSNLPSAVDRAVRMYNEEKPHSSLKWLSPIQFENAYICSGQTSIDEKSTTE